MQEVARLGICRFGWTLGPITTRNFRTLPLPRVLWPSLAQGAGQFRFLLSVCFSLAPWQRGTTTDQAGRSSHLSRGLPRYPPRWLRYHRMPLGSASSTTTWPRLVWTRRATSPVSSTTLRMPEATPSPRAGRTRLRATWWQFGLRRADALRALSARCRSRFRHVRRHLLLCRLRWHRVLHLPRSGARLWAPSPRLLSHRSRRTC